MNVPLADIGGASLYILIGWLLSAIVSSYLSERKGYGERVGLACGMILTVVGVVLWLVWPAKPGSAWKQDGPIGRRSRPTA